MASVEINIITVPKSQIYVKILESNKYLKKLPINSITVEPKIIKITFINNLFIFSKNFIPDFK